MERTAPYYSPLRPISSASGEHCCCHPVVTMIMCTEQSLQPLKPSLQWVYWPGPSQELRCAAAAAAGCSPLHSCRASLLASHTSPGEMNPSDTRYKKNIICYCLNILYYILVTIVCLSLTLYFVVCANILCTWWLCKLDAILSTVNAHTVNQRL